MGGEHAVAAGGPAGGGAAVEALAGLIAREGVAGVHDVLERLAGRVVGGDKIERSAASPNQVFYNTKVDGEDNGPQRDGALR